MYAQHDHTQRARQLVINAARRLTQLVRDVGTHEHALRRMRVEIGAVPRVHVVENVSVEIAPQIDFARCSTPATRTLTVAHGCSFRSIAWTKAPAPCEGSRIGNGAAPFARAATRRTRRVLCAFSARAGYDV